MGDLIETNQGSKMKLLLAAIILLLPFVWSKAPCKDLLPNCAYLKSTGWYACNWVGGYLYDNCKQTCGYCKLPVIPTPWKGCHNFEKNCGAWVKQGQCEKNPKFMSKYCCKACGGVKPTKPTTLKPSKCHDLNAKFCQARKNRCYYDRSVMSKNCMKTCRMCSMSSKCFDKNSVCPYWKSQGYCSTKSPYRQHMLTHCRYTCLGC